MKICAISYHSCPYTLLGGEDTGGMSVYLKEIASTLSAFPGTKVDIFTRARDAQVCGIKNVSSSVRVIYLKAGPLRTVGRNEVQNHLPEFINNLKEFILSERDDYDLIYSHYWLSGIAGDEIKRMFEIPLVHTYHTLAFLKDKVLKEKEFQHRRKAEKEISEFSDVIISSSYEEKNSLIHEYGISSSKVKVISPGVNERIFHPCKDEIIYEETGFRKEQKVLLFVGRIQPVKGLITLVEALQVLKQQNMPFFEQLRVLVIGGGEQSFDLQRNKEYLLIENAIQEGQINDHVIFLGSKEQDELKRYYSAADVLVVPSLYESFGLVVVEAMACGTPVIASRIGRIKTLIKEGCNGLTFRPDDALSLAAGLERFYSERDCFWSSEMTRHSVLKQHSWEKAAQNIFQAFLNLQVSEIYPTTIFRPDESPQPA
jgi:D-inositol-3-phosphate glycosyltransferase